MLVAKEILNKDRNKRLQFREQKEQNDEYLPKTGYPYMLTGRNKPCHSNPMFEFFLNGWMKKLNKR